MHFRHYLAVSAAALSLSVALAAPAAAQETSSSVRGTVETASGPVAGAAVTVSVGNVSDLSVVRQYLDVQFG